MTSETASRFVVETRLAIPLALLAAAAWAAAGSSGSAADLAPRVEVEEDVYSYEPANNGAGPMWCHGNTSLVRVGDQVLASGIETLAGAKPYNNCVPLLFHRADDGWVQVYKGGERTREPCPLTVFPDGRVYLSVNPTLAKPDTQGGPARPQILQFSAADPGREPSVVKPVWDGEPRFTEHSYRSFVADADRQELVLFQNIGYTHAEWCFRDQNGDWSAQGRLVWPWGAEYDRPQPIRVCYPTVALRNRAVYFCGVSDIVEPYDAWRAYKKKLTGREWDYDFRRLFYTWCDDITTGKFADWVEVSSRDKTCGWIFPADLYVAPGGDVFLLWSERALDERLREEFFPEAKQRHALLCGLVRDGKVVRRTTLAEGGDGLGGLRPGAGRFQVTEDGRLLVFYYVGGSTAAGQPVAENRIVQINADATCGESVAVGLQKPLAQFFTATVRAGCRPANTLDLLGDVGGTLRYVRIGL